ncbi:MAG: hypothetical protein ABR878_00840 [Roseiarcus sp.]|jgi:hypothetical protein
MAIDSSTLSEDQIKVLAQTATRITAPTFHASAINIMWAGNDGIIVFSRPQPATLPPLGEFAPFALNEITAVIHLSAATLKDLSILLSTNVAEYEKRTGVTIQTDYTRRLAAGA